MIEDYDGRYWHPRTLTWHGQTIRTYEMMCSDRECLWPVSLRRDILGQWYATHEHSGFSVSTKTGPSTVTSPRFDEWQLAARWADEHGLLDACEVSR